jgi:hypothetical protein
MKLNKWLKIVLVIIVLAGIGTMLIWAIMHGRKELAMEQEREQPIKAPSRVSAQGREAVVTLDPDTQKEGGIVTSPLETASHQRELIAYGTVLSFQPLINLRDQYAAAQAKWESAESSLSKSSKIYERRQQLLQEKAISPEMFQSDEQTWRADKAGLFSAREEFQMLKSQIEQQWGPVLAKWVYEESPQFNRLRFQEEVLLQVTLPSDVMITSPPSAALVDTSYATKISAKFIVSASRTDPRIQGQSFFYVAPAKDVGMLPGMNVIAYLATGPRVQGVVIPSSAVVWWQGNAWVYIQTDSVHFVRREVSTDSPVKDGWFLKKVELQGDRIVIKGAQLLLSEEFRTQIKVGQEG